MFFMNGQRRTYKNIVMRDELNSALLKAHDVGDVVEIARLYGSAGDMAEGVDEACFFWVQAYVFALEAGIPEADKYRANLRKFGREA